MHRVREVRTADVDELARVVARAFADDPIMRWVLPDDRTRVARMTRMNKVVFGQMAVIAGRHMLTTDDLAGMATWAPPGTWKSSGWRMLGPTVQLVAILRSGLLRLTRGFAELEKRHPREPHWYLEGLGTDPPRQRTGVGSALITPVLDECDADATGAYLETQLEGNVPFYRAHGFEVVDELDMPGGGPHIWRMWRDPRPADPQPRQ